MFTMVITRVMIETISKLNVNKSFTVMYSIGNTPLQGQDLTAYRLDLSYPTRLYHIVV